MRDDVSSTSFTFATMTAKRYGYVAPTAPVTILRRMATQ
jgi:hypothetical protein